MKSNRIGLKLGIAFSVLIAILIGIGVLSLHQMSRMNDRTQEVTDVLWAKVKLAQEALHYSDLNNRITMEAFLVDDKQQIAGMLVQRAANTRTITEIYKKIGSQCSTEEETALLAKVQAVRAPYVNGYLTALDLLIRQDKPRAARQMMIDVTIPNLKAYHAALSDFVAYQGHQTDLAGDAVEARYWSARRQLVLLLTCAAFIAAYVTRRMTREISVRQRAELELRKAHEGLELRVRERTAELRQAHVQLLETSRLAGMAEVATGVLHNVGNVLNSVNVAASLITEKVNQSPIANLCRATDMLDFHRADLAFFLTNDEKGRHLPDYVSMVAKVLREENATVITELSGLAHGIEHIKQIVQSQQHAATTSTVRSAVKPAVLLEDALRINLPSLDKHGIKIIREIDNVDTAEIDSHKTLQILVNLISNARNAVKDRASGQSPPVTPTVTLGLAEVLVRDTRFLRYQVIDSGSGIAPENLSRIFNYGFTTRSEGHGFGLHSAANAAKEMGGSLTAFSDGPGTGARFTLDIPILCTEAKAA